MSRCVCDLLGPRLQPHAHRFHEVLAQRLRHVAEASARYRPFVGRRERTDPERDAIIADARYRLQRVREHGQRYLHDYDFSRLPGTGRSTEQPEQTRSAEHGRH